MTTPDRRLPTLLSHLLVAYVVELDNEFERRVPHRREGLAVMAENRHAPRLVSLAIWATCLRHIPDEGITVADLERVGRTGTNLDGVRRWGYVTVGGRNRAGPARPARRADVLTLTEIGRRARDEWSALVPEIERRWGERFGLSSVRDFLGDLSAVDAQTGNGLSDCLPILGYGLWCAAGLRPGDGPAPTSLYGLLSRVLLAFAVEAERETTVSMAVGANVLRPIGAHAVPAAQLPARAGVGREAIATCVRYLEKQGMVTVGLEPDGGRARIARLTERGIAALAVHEEVLARTEARWRERFGDPTVERLRDAAGAMAIEADETSSRLFDAIRPFSGEWRSESPAPTVLPDFPMVLHRGGWPDGS